MTEMIAAEPALAGRIVARLTGDGGPAARLAAEVRRCRDASLPVAVVGCGTSEHAAMGIAAIFHDALRRPEPTHGGPAAVPPWVVARQALEAALDPWPGLCLAVSHEGGTWATLEALRAARAAGATTALITAAAGSPAARLADVLLATDELDQSWCHTVGYLSPLVAGVVVAGYLTGVLPDQAAVANLVGAGLESGRAAAADALAARLAGASRILVTAAGADEPAARELVLKIEEGSWVPAAYRHLETILHGHLAAVDEGTAVVLVLTERRARAQRVERAREVLTALATIGASAGAILAAGAADGIPDLATPAGRITVPEAASFLSSAAGLLSSAVPLQLVAEGLARHRGVNPDPIRRQDPRYRRAAEAVR
jgi:fructoselysine-6-P-deglycase FrlB-like protein